MKRYLELFKKVGTLKKTDREGWKRFDIEDVESVADHSFRAAFMALVLGDSFDLDGFKLIKLLLVHDLAESEIGDITPHDPISEEEKMIKEEEAIEEISRFLDIDLDILELWKEFECDDSKEAVIARDIDRLERVLQAREYQEEYPDKDLSEFLRDVKRRLESEEVRDIANKMLS